MTDLTFVHLTDLHILPSTEDLLKEQRTADKLRGVIRLIRNMQISPDFFILSGDLANDGRETEYRTLNVLLDELREFGAPLMLGLGNHDRRVQFRQVVLGKEGTDESQRYYHSAMFGGLRVIMLDSKAPEAVHGDLDALQLTWLAEELRQPAPLGNLIAVHHPPVFSTVEPLNEHCLRNPEALAQTIAGHHVHAILSGHIHYPHITSFHDTISITTPATAYILDPGSQLELQATDGWGFTLGSLRGGQLYCNPISMHS
jgi:3',5'-cyclic AMP phosphodiesterase CpdA